MCPLCVLHEGTQFASIWLREDEEVLDAAHLAIHYSPVRGTDRAPVHVATAKHVHKPKGAKPGLVNLSGGRILEVRVQQERLEALLRGVQRG